MDTSIVLSDIDLLEDIWWFWHLQRPLTTDQIDSTISRLSGIGFLVSFNETRNPHIELLFYNEVTNLYISMLTPSEEDHSFLAMGTFEKHFLSPNAIESRLLADQFLEVGKIIYEELRPHYGFVRNLGVFVEPGDIDSNKLTHLFWAQVFDSSFVDGFGREILANAPAWRNENLEGGGLLYVLAMSPYLYAGKQQYWQQAITYFAKHGVKPFFRSDQSM